MRKKWGSRLERNRGGFKPGKARKVFASRENLADPRAEEILCEIAGAGASTD